MNGSMTGRVFNNRYQITDRVGIGGMAEVYQAQDRVLGRRVAIKVMLPQYAADPEFTRRFRQEAASAANLSSPYIVNVYDWGQDDGTYYIVMEYVRGSDLKTAIQQRGPITQRKAAEIGSQVCQALSVAHNQDIVHRDIKPQNIMIQPDGNIKVMDFGIARAKNSVGQRTSAVLGTAHYISPEQAQGKDCTATSDIYSLGIVLYEATTGQLPFDGPDAISVATKQVNEYPKLPSEINPEIDPALEAIIMRALEKDPNARFADAQEMKQALNDYLAGRAGSGMAQQPTQFINYANPGATTVMPVNATGGMKPITSVNPVVEADAKQGKKKGGKGRIIAILAVIAAIAIAAFAFFNANSNEVPVPDVEGKTVSKATEMLQDAGFKVGKQTETYSENVDKGLVVGTNPEGGKRAPKGSTVDILVSQGAEEATVPDLSDMTAQEAQEALKKAGLVGKAGTSEKSDEVEKGKVMSQDPQPGEKVALGTTVTYVISLGGEEVDVPNVVGSTEADATATLEAAGFKVSVSSTESGSVPDGCVARQNPGAGEKAAKGDTVTITVKKGGKHSVSASCSPAEGGTISLSTSEVDDGGGVNYTISVSPGYTIASITDNYGGSYGASASGYIGNITADTVIYVTFASTTGGGIIYNDPGTADQPDPEPATEPEEPNSASTEAAQDDNAE